MGWKQYLGLEYVDYADQLFQSLARTRYAKRQFSLVLTLIFVGIVKWYLKILFSFLIQIHPIIDFILQIGFAIVLAFKDHWVRNIVDRFRTEIYALSRYLINNYTPENFKTWKRNTVLLISLYFIVHLLFIEVTKWLLIQQILHFLITYFCIESIENGLIVDCYERIKRFWQKIFCKKKSGRKIVNNKDFYIQEDYLKGIDENSIINSNIQESSKEDDNNDNKNNDNNDESQILTKSWMLLSDVVVLKDDLNRSIVVFED